MTIKITPTLRKALIYTTLGAVAGAITLGIRNDFHLGQWMMAWGMVSLAAVGLFGLAGKDD